jgi:hypothetical protein
VGGGPSGFRLTRWRKGRSGRPAPLGRLCRLVSSSSDIVEMILYNAKENEIAIFSGFEKKIIFFEDLKSFFI